MTQHDQPTQPNLNPAPFATNPNPTSTRLSLRGTQVSQRGTLMSQRGTQMSIPRAGVQRPQWISGDAKQAAILVRD